jgi:SAM-dependent methyltransferase
VGCSVSSPASRGYGSLEWFTQQYCHVADDPWGLTWRPSQALRYHSVLEILTRVPHSLTTAVDIGCATGDLTALLARRMPGLRVLLGVDFVDSAVERARRRFPHITFVRDSILSLGDRYSAQFDLALCLELLYYLEKGQRVEALKSVRRLLRKGGYAVFSSLISHEPYFQPDQLLDLVSREFHIMASQVLHLRLLATLEAVARRSDHLALRLSRGRWSASAASILARLSLPSVAVLEKWSRALPSLSRSHSIVLARADA